MKRILGKSGIEVSAMGLGCWAIGGPFVMDGKADGWGEIDDHESIRAIHKALDLGVNFLDTADAYGTGHSEQIIAKALEGRRDQVVIATKFGFMYNEAEKQLTGVFTDADDLPTYIRQACEASLRRLNTDYIDLYQLHCGASPEQAEVIADTLEQLQKAGHIRTFGWSTDDPASIRLWAKRPYCTTVQNELNVLRDASEVLTVCDEYHLASINRSPLAYGFLSGKYTADSVMSKDDFRGAGHEWVGYFENGRPKQEFLDKLTAIREILTSNGRSLVQGALAWIWARSDKTIPIPGFKTVKQIEENCAAMQFGPLTTDQKREIDSLLNR
jgi:aryl-alcohol dehydrogenase-like predicted oxidoreductase